jgi:hypothetical protein
MGMSGLGTNSSQPTTTSTFAFKIIDIGNTEVELSSVTIDGNTTFGCFQGKGRLQIPFASIAHIDFNKDNACVTMVDGTQVCNLKTNAVSRLYGHTSFGAYQIALKDIKTMVVLKSKNEP